MRWPKLVAFLLTAVTYSSLALAQTPAPSSSEYSKRVREDKPVAYFRFSGANSEALGGSMPGADNPRLAGRKVDKVRLGVAGPRPDVHPLFAETNTAAHFFGQRGSLRVDDPGDDSILDFDQGDSITLEAWVKPTKIKAGSFAYIVGKGRTHNKGFSRHNQNYALRLLGTTGGGALSFLFRNANDKSDDDYHRWNSAGSVPANGQWHHIALVYTFGKPQSVRGYIDGEQVKGKWDKGGATDKPPLVDNDQLWIGSSYGGSPNATFNGSIDEVAIYRQALSAEQITRKYEAISIPPPTITEQLAALPGDAVQYDVIENVTIGDWSIVHNDPSQSFQTPAFGLVRLPRKYTRTGVIDDRSSTFLVVARCALELPAGKYELLLRARNGSRLWIDEQLVAELDFLQREVHGSHEPVPELTESGYADLAPLETGQQEKIATIELPAGRHLVRLETFCGGNSMRPELGGLSVGLARPGQLFELVAPQSEHRVVMDDRQWRSYTANALGLVAKIDQQNRKLTGSEAEYWQWRHKLARQEVSGSSDAIRANDDLSIDRLLDARFAAANIEPTPLTNDYQFIRRITLDTIGIIPDRAAIAAFMSDRSPNRRANLIDGLLDDPRWADHWVSYWQDVLAENPGILKPKLNNTGPFRWWIYESFLDNKPFDQFVTELVMMQGSSLGGGPAGFAMATQNDVPMAAKAHVLAQAFMGLEMKCARCHDAPYHTFTQQQLFNVAAMLGRKTLTLPESSTVPIVEGARKPLVNVKLKPGTKIKPEWSFGAMAPVAGSITGLVRDPGDTRELLAGTLTSPRNERFAQVIVNRLWKRYLGRGLVEPVDDWEHADPEQKDLLKYLARDFVMHGYDLKHTARLIFNSHAYQRQVATGENASDLKDLFASPVRRRMTAEQVVDSLFAAAGKPLGSEPMTLDPQGRRPIATFIHLGNPTRAWHFTSLSNERDRPALALPVAQSIVDVLVSFGWRDARPSPITDRDNTPTVQQPLALANGTVGNRIAQLSEDSSVTELALSNVPVDELIENVFLQFLSRRPASDERKPFVQLLEEGYEDRFRTPNAHDTRPRKKQHRVSWSNHLSAEATRIKLEMERLARAGDPPTRRLDADWRERMEDVVWALVNSPEFLFIP